MKIMTNNTDDFEQDGLEDMDVDPTESKGPPSVRRTIAEAWRTKPVFKLIVIMFVVALAVAAALGMFSSPPSAPDSTIAGAPQMNEAPGGKSSPYFIEQNKQANAQRANQALQKGGSALPTPVGNPVDIDDLANPNKKDPLQEFRAETERLKEEMKQQQQQQQQQMQGLQQQVQVISREPEDDSLAKAMQKQMQQLMEGWVPHNMKVVNGATKEKDETAAQQRMGVQDSSGNTMMSASNAATAATQATAVKEKALIPAGTVNYAQLLTEANSDVQAPILAQVLSGPLSGGRAIGRFQVMNDYLVMEFTLVTLKGKDYTVDALALDPNTTLAGLATEVDHRYFSRVLLPAAGAFVSAFGSSLGQSNSTTTVSSGTVTVDQAKKSYNEAIYSGIGAAGSAASQFFQQQAAQTKTLVRVAVGTPLGLFFLSSVKETNAQAAQNNTAMGTLAAAYNGAMQGAANGGVSNGGYSVIGSGTTTNASAATNTSYNPYATSYYGTNNGTGSYNPYGAQGSVSIYPSSGYNTGYYNRY
jgi:intracellular multiplication protein IcmE